MSEALLEKAVCEKCDSPVRENTLFCYNCGNNVAEDQVIETVTAVESDDSEADIDVRTKAALDDMVERFRIDEDNDDHKLAHAAAERKRARVTKRRLREFVWQPHDESSSMLIVFISVLVTVLVAVIVLFTLFWK